MKLAGELPGARAGVEDLGAGTDDIHGGLKTRWLRAGRAQAQPEPTKSVIDGSCAPVSLVDAAWPVAGEDVTERREAEGGADPGGGQRSPGAFKAMASSPMRPTTLCSTIHRSSAGGARLGTRTTGGHKMGLVAYRRSLERRSAAGAPFDVLEDWLSSLALTPRSKNALWL